MGNKSKDRKRQKTKETNKTNDNWKRPSALLLDDSLKGQEELQLESLLFVKPPRRSTLPVPDEPQINNELSHLKDSDLFFVDDNSQPPITLDETSEEENEGSHPDSIAWPVPSTSTSYPGSSSRPAAWEDPADPTLRVGLMEKKQRRKLRTTAEEDEVSGTLYENKLRNYFTSTNPTPQWALDARSRARGQKKRRLSASSSTDEGSENDFNPGSELGTVTGEIFASKSGRSNLKNGILSIERLRDVNYSSRSQGSIHSLEFHPNPKVPVLFAAAGDRRIRLFNVDGHTNPHLQTVHIPALPITGASFHPSGSSILSTGPRPFYYNFDLQSETVIRSAVKSVSVQNGDLSMEIRRFSPAGNLLAVAGRHGYIHLLDWTASGGEQVICSLKSNSPVTALSWSRSGNHIYSLGQNSDIFVWDVGQRQCINKWQDEGGYGSKHMSSDDRGSYLSVGSSSGFVNVYDLNETTLNAEVKPKFLKSLGHLTTPTSSMSFNGSSEVLSVASSSKKSQFRLIHLPSLTAFSNWPTAGTPLGLVNTAAFSPTSHYVAIGNSQGQALLYSLRHFKDQ